MPIVTTRLEERIYIADYEGDLLLAEIISGNMEALAQEHSEIPYIAIIDASNVKKIPFDVKGVRSMDVSYSADTVIIINPPIMVSILVDILRRLISKRVIIVTSRQEALEKARAFREAIIV